ncbi:MAG: LacI family DNA-binding transcriptional regulator [Lachnospiraceae bacterium]|nr:LacI family DNA-binding transcriptional regulator [Lachnospiraceae bacterium]
MVSIKDVAKHAGVAISTVSKVLNNYPNVSEDTRKKVNAAIDELGFVPNSIASALSSKKTDRVALLLDANRHAQAIDEIPMKYILGAINKAKELHIDIITVFFTMIQEMSVEEVIRYFQSQSIEGLIICGLSKQDTMLHELIATGKFKIVLIDAPGVSESTSSIHINHKQAQYEVAKEMILENKKSFEEKYGVGVKAPDAVKDTDGEEPYEWGKKILYIAGKQNGYVSDERMQGMQQLAEEMALNMTVVTGNFSELQARNITWEYANEQDAIVCASDLMAIGSMKALIDMDIFRPVCGFDGINLMGYAGKQMHTVKQDFQEIAATAVNEMMRLMAGEEGREVIMPHQLIRIEYKDVIS